MASFQINPWITFLRQYGPISRADNMYDESIQRALRRSKLPPVAFDAPHLPKLLDNLRSNEPSSIILTGTAGDGKTFLCRRVWEELGGDSDAWRSDEKIRQHKLPSKRRLTVVKDLSELGEKEASLLLARMADAICGKTHSEVFLVAANDGQLVEAWKRAPGEENTRATQALIEGLLVGRRERKDGYALHLYNLRQTSAAELLQRILPAVLGHRGWKGCDGCRGQQPGPENRCPIWENYIRLQDEHFQRRLLDLLTLCDHNERHLTIRQVLAVVSNMLLGHEDVRDALLRCEAVPEVVAQGKSALASPYSNTFGENLPSARREGVEAFEVLGQFGIGDETSNRIDDALVYGTDDPSLKEIFDTVVAADTIYGGTEAYRSLQAAYLEGEIPEAAEQFLQLLRRQRQRIFFTLPPEREAPLRLWHLTVIQYAGEYLRVFNDARDSRPARRQVLSRLVRGLNRVFTGMLADDDRQVILATSGSHSQARVSRIEEGSIEVEPRLGQSVGLELSEGRLTLIARIDRDTSVSLPLHLVRYEFLSRVAEGALPSSFSRECYEDLLAFKSRLLRAYWTVQGRHGQATPETTLRLLDVDEHGLFRSRRLEIRQ